jgi:hypothetical protein
MKFFSIRLIALNSVILLSLGACSNNDSATKADNPTTTSTSESKAETTTATKDGEKHSEKDGHDHSKDEKDSHKGQIVQSGKYHVEFNSHLEKDSTHLDVKLHGEKEKEINDAKLTAQVQLPGGTSQSLPVSYNAEEKQYVAKLPTTATGEYQVVLQTDVKGEKFNTRFSFKR